MAKSTPLPITPSPARAIPALCVCMFLLACLVCETKLNDVFLIAFSICRPK